MVLTARTTNTMESTAHQHHRQEHYHTTTTTAINSTNTTTNNDSLSAVCCRRVKSYVRASPRAQTGVHVFMLSTIDLFIASWASTKTPSRQSESVAQRGATTDNNPRSCRKYPAYGAQHTLPLVTSIETAASMKLRAREKPPARLTGALDTFLPAAVSVAGSA